MSNDILITAAVIAACLFFVAFCVLGSRDLRRMSEYRDWELYMLTGIMSDEMKAAKAKYEAEKRADS